MNAPAATPPRVASRSRLLTPVARYDTRNGLAEIHIHGVPMARYKTACGLNLLEISGHTFFKVEPEGTPVSCPGCLGRS